MGKRGDRRRQKELQRRKKIGNWAKLANMAKQANQEMHQQRNPQKIRLGFLQRSSPKLGTPPPPIEQIQVAAHPTISQFTPPPQLTYSEVLNRFLNDYRCPECNIPTQQQEGEAHLCTKCGMSWTLEKVFALKTQLPP